jgi:hypothetical protein
MVTGMTVTGRITLEGVHERVAQGVHGGDEWKRSPQHAGDGVTEALGGELHLPNSSTTTIVSSAAAKAGTASRSSSSSATP